MWSLKIANLYKTFGEITAVDDVSFEVEMGKVAALLGGNGAGKTTTLSMLLGLLIPDAGRIEILGIDMLSRRYEVLPRINFSSPYVDLPKRLTVRENLRVYSRLYGLKVPARRLDQLAEDLDFGDILDRPYGQLSSGQRTRISLAKSLLNEPEVLLLDEPTASLDPDTADWIRHYLIEFNRASGATIFMASHNMSEVERMCSTVLMMKEGRIVEQGSPAALRMKYGRDDLEDVFIDITRERTNPEVG